MQRKGRRVATERLVDRQLMQILRQMPSLSTSAETLTGQREAVGAWRLRAPETQKVRVDELLIESDNARSVRVLVYTPEGTLNGALLWIHGGGMVMGARNE